MLATHSCALAAMKWDMQHHKRTQMQKMAFIMLALSDAFAEGEKNPSFFSLIDFVSENIMLLFSYQLLKSLELLRL